MTVQVMTLTEIISALREIPDLREVGDAASLERAAKNVRVTPSAFVFPLRESSGEPRGATGARRQRVMGGFAVFLLAKDVRSDAGVGAKTEIETLRGAVIGKLLALKPTWADAPIEHVSGRLTSGILKGGVLAWQDEFRAPFRRSVG